MAGEMLKLGGGKEPVTVICKVLSAVLLGVIALPEAVDEPEEPIEAVIVCAPGLKRPAT